MAQHKRCIAGFGAGMVSVIALMISAGAAQGAGDPYEWRTINGTGNNVSGAGRWDWGSTEIQLKRSMPAAYADGWTPSGADRPNPRTISNTIFNQTHSIQNSRGLTDMVWQWGQFVDHDMDLSPADSGEFFNINVPSGDPVFPDGTVFPLQRTRFDPSTGTDASNPRQQINEITSWIDASNVYGSTTGRASWLRSTDPAKKGQLRITAHATGDLMPYNDGSQHNEGGPGTNLFVAGDTRANEQVGLISMHTLFVREHNRWAEAFSSAQPQLSSDEVYDRARRVVGAQMQTVTYNEFLPALLGSEMGSYSGGYDPNVDGSIKNEFASAFFRVGHTMLSPEIKRLDAGGDPIPEGNLSLSDAFFRPDRIASEGGIDPILRGLASQVMQEIDAKVIGDVRNLLFGAPGAGGSDLVSLNIQRGRDHGLCDYNTARVEMGFAPVTSFDQITSDTALASALRDAYGQTGGQDNVHLVDMWVGALSEDKLPGSSLGPMLAEGLRGQFEALRTGDRFYYEHDADLASILAEVGFTIADLEGRLLSDIIMDNTGITGLRDNVFLIPTPGALSILALTGAAALRRRRR